MTLINSIDCKYKRLIIRGNKKVALLICKATTTLTCNVLFINVRFNEANELFRFYFTSPRFKAAFKLV